MCGWHTTRPLEELEREECEERKKYDSKGVTPPLRARLGPLLKPPSEPLPLGISTATFLGVLIIMSVLNYPTGLFNVVLALLSSAGVYYHFKRNYDATYKAWRDSAEGAQVCPKCWACFPQQR